MHFTRYLHEIICNRNRGRAKRVARMLDKPYSTFMRELNPYDSRAKLGVDTLLDYMTVTGDLRPLAYMASRVGVRLCPGEKAVDVEGLDVARERVEAAVH